MRRSETLSGLVLDAKYPLAELIGEGGMGTVYSARHLGTDRLVAVKVLRRQALLPSPKCCMAGSSAAC